MELNLFELGFAQAEFGAKRKLHYRKKKIACWWNLVARLIGLVCSYLCNVSYCKQATFMLEKIHKGVLCFWDRKSSGCCDVAYKNKPNV